MSGLLTPQAAMLHSPLKYLQVAFQSSCLCSAIMLSAAMLHCPLQYLRVTFQSSY